MFPIVNCLFVKSEVKKQTKGATVTLPLFYFTQKMSCMAPSSTRVFVNVASSVHFFCPGSIFPPRPPAKTLQNISSGSKLACSCGQTSQYAQLSRWAWKTFSYLRNWVAGKKDHIFHPHSDGLISRRRHIWGSLKWASMSKMWEEECTCCSDRINI